MNPRKYKQKENEKKKKQKAQIVEKIKEFQKTEELMSEES